MHLRRNNRNQEPQSKESSAQQQHHKKRQYRGRDEVEFETLGPLKAEPEFDWMRLSIPKEVRALALERKALSKEITKVDNRLRFGYSEPLYDYRMELVKKDIVLSCQMTEKLINL